jgi:hypothetical protein
MARTGRPRTVSLPMDEIRELAARGWCLRELANKYGCSRQCMSERMKEAGIPRLPQWSQPGERNGQWKGGRQLDSDGYVLIHSPDHPCRNAAGCVREHRLVMESILGRHLTPTEVVHHKDDNPANNEPSNLELYETNADHLRETLAGQVPRWSEDGKRRIRQGILRSLAARHASTRKASRNGGSSSR